ANAERARTQNTNAGPASRICQAVGIADHDGGNDSPGGESRHQLGRWIRGHHGKVSRLVQSSHAAEIIDRSDTAPKPAGLQIGQYLPPNCRSSTDHNDRIWPEQASRAEAAGGLIAQEVHTAFAEFDTLAWKWGRRGNRIKILFGDRQGMRRRAE